MVAFIADHTVRILQSSRAELGTEFEEVHAHISRLLTVISGTVFEVCTAAFNAVRTVQIFCCFGHENRGLNIYYSAQKSRLRLLLIWHCFREKIWHRNRGSICTENEAACWVEIS